jgi:hypothetical protein
MLGAGVLGAGYTASKMRRRWEGEN